MSKKFYFTAFGGSKIGENDSYQIDLQIDYYENRILVKSN